MPTLKEIADANMAKVAAGQGWYTDPNTGGWTQTLPAPPPKTIPTTGGVPSGPAPTIPTFGGVTGNRAADESAIRQGMGFGTTDGNIVDAAKGVTDAFGMIGGGSGTGGAPSWGTPGATQASWEANQQSMWNQQMGIPGRGRSWMQNWMADQYDTMNMAYRLNTSQYGGQGGFGNLGEFSNEFSPMQARQNLSNFYGSNFLNQTPEQQRLMREELPEVTEQGLWELLRGQYATPVASRLYQGIPGAEAEYKISQEGYGGGSFINSWLKSIGAR